MSEIKVCTGGMTFKIYASQIPGPKGDTGTVFTPSVSEEGVISWTNDGGKENPEPVDLTSGAEDAARAAAENWLDEHIDPETGYAVDDSLSVEGAAADSKAVGDAVGALDEVIRRSESKQMVKLSDATITGKYINLSGQVVDAAFSQEQWEVTDYVDVSAYKKVAITAGSYTGFMYYAFYNESKQYIANSGRAYQSGVSLRDEVVAVPAGAKYCVAMWYYTNARYDPIIKGVKEVISNILTNKVVSILGDSISTYDGWIPVADGHNLAHRSRYISDTAWYNGSVNDTWWKKLIDTVGAKLGINDSWAGSKVSNSSSTDTGDVGPNACMAGVTRITNLGANGTPDVIFFYGGTNDAGTSVPVGTFDSTATYMLDLVSVTWSTFADAYKDAIMRLQHYYPDAKIIVLLPTYTTSYYNMANLDAYNEIIKEVCDYFGVDYIDLRRCGINYANVGTTLGDGTHPTVKGFAMMENYIRAKLFSLILDDGYENTVYSVSNDLSVCTNSSLYIHGVSAGKAYEATISGSRKAYVTVTMGGTDVTQTAYDASTGEISIDKVTGDIVITDNAEITMYTSEIGKGDSPTNSNVNGYGWVPVLPVSLTGNPINVVRFQSESTSGTFEIGIVNQINGTTIRDVQSVAWTAADKDANGIVTVILPSAFTLSTNEMIVISPSTQPDYTFKYAINSGSTFYTRVPSARDGGTSWGTAVGAVLRHDFGYLDA